jgi:hypothetical protein
VTRKDNLPWIHAGNQTAIFHQRCVELASTLKGNERVCLLGIPKEENGAHLVLNNIMFAKMMMPPYSNPGCSEKFLTFDPIFFGDNNYINSDRLKSVLQDPEVKGVYVWQPSSKTLRKLEFSPSKGIDGNLNLCLGSQGQSAPGYFGFNFSNLEIDPQSLDCLSLSFKAAKKFLPAKERVCNVSWTGDRGTYGRQSIVFSEVVDGNVQLIVPLASDWHWYTMGQIRSIAVQAVGLTPLLPISLTSSSVKVLPATFADVAPKLSIVNQQMSNSGVVAFEPGKSEFSLGAQPSAQRKGILVEVTKTNFFFDGLSNEDAESARATSSSFDLGNEARKMSADWFKRPGYYQLRARYIGFDGEPAKVSSVPITLYWSGHPATIN